MQLLNVCSDSSLNETDSWTGFLERRRVKCGLKRGCQTWPGRQNWSGKGSSSSHSLASENFTFYCTDVSVTAFLLMTRPMECKRWSINLMNFFDLQLHFFLMLFKSHFYIKKSPGINVELNLFTLKERKPVRGDARLHVSEHVSPSALFCLFVISFRFISVSF